MAISKKDKINALNNEVAELHPLLNELFKKMPSITGVEYTHGNKEFGADFILTQDYEPLGTIEYIGVIVKSRSITQSSLDDVERQIKECSLPRLIEGGKKKIVLSAIWVISNQNIAGNAQEKINYSFSEKKIQFIDDEKIVWLIDKYLPNYWDNVELYLSNYLAQTRTRIEEEDKRFTLIPNLSPEVYIEPDIVRVVNDGYDYKDGKKKKLYEQVNINEEIEQGRFILVEGQMGSGKSKLLRHLCLNYANPNVYLEKKIIPIAINYRHLCESYGCNLTTLIREYFSKYGVRLTDPDKIVVLIDGFDEYNESIEEHIEKIKLLLMQKESFAKISVVVATRFMNILNSEDFNKSDARKVEISSLSFKKMIEFLTTLCTKLNIADRLVDDLTKSPLMKELPQSPIAAILLAKVIENNSRDLPSNMPELYQKYLELALGRWDIEKGLESQKEYDVSSAIAIELALYFIDNEIDEISYDQMIELIGKYLGERNLGIITNRVLEILINRAGIIVKNIENNTVLFSHRTFAEFFYAKGKTDNNSLIIDQRVFSIYWMNIFYFYIGIKRDCYDYLQSIINLEPENEGQKLIKIINTANYLMAGYSTPYKIVELNFHKILLDAGNFYKRLVDGSIESPFRKIPEVILLWWMQHIIRNSYSYAYFSKGIDDCVLQIVDDSEYDHSTKAYALFFLSMIGIEQDNTNPLDYLISDYKVGLPESVQIGIINEVERLKTKNNAQKQSLKWFGKKLKNLEKSYVKELFEIPISKRKIT